MNKKIDSATNDLDRELHAPGLLVDRYSEMLSHAQALEAERDEWERRARELYETIEAIAKHQEIITGSMARHSSIYRIAKGMLGDAAKWFEESSE